MKVALVGPASPDRGGIAHQTRLLAQHLGPNLAAYLTFSRRYPRWLDPRRFDHASEEPSGAPAAAPIFDYANPASWRATARVVADSGARAVVIPWWTAFWAIPVRGFFRELARAGSPFRVLLCHNVVEHESSLARRWLSAGAFGAADGFIVHAGGDRDRLSAADLGKPILLLPHAVESRPRPDRREARRRLGVEGPLVLALGLVRRYKGIETLIEAAPAIARESGAAVAVVGEVFPDARDVAVIARRTPGVRFVDDYVAEAEMDEWLAACDVVVCPYREVSGSGIVARAIGAGRPVVASDLPAFREVVTQETGAFFLAGDARALAAAVSIVLSRGVDSYRAALERAAERYSWQSYADAVARFAESRGAG